MKGLEMMTWKRGGIQTLKGVFRRIVTWYAILLHPKSLILNLSLAGATFATQQSGTLCQSSRASRQPHHPVPSPSSPDYPPKDNKTTPS